MNSTRTQFQDRCVIVFGRYPIPGQVKTRLIPLLGPLGAADLQRRLTERIIDTLLGSGLAAVRYCFCGADQYRVQRWLQRPGLELCLQSQGDLGRRMAFALDSALQEGYRKVLLLGTDLPGITPDHIRSAFQALDDHDLVLGPSTDGGYWLVGAQKPAAVFDDIPWGSDCVLERTLAAASKLGLKTAQLDPLDDIDTPVDLKRWQPGRDWRRPFLSVILPVLNEADHIETAVEQVRSPYTQVIVVDGGSRDKTVELARDSGATVMSSRPGRALQQNLGARQARGRILLFLHADTRLPVDFETQLFETLMNPQVVLGAFRFKTDMHGAGMRLIEKVAHIRSTLLQMPYGDQAFFLRKHLFEQVGGFPEVPIAEDLLLVRRLNRQGRIELAPAKALTSARRWRARGLWHTTLVNYLIAGGCLLGVAPARLAALYDLGIKKNVNHRLKKNCNEIRTIQS